MKEEMGDEKRKEWVILGYPLSRKGGRKRAKVEGGG